MQGGFDTPQDDPFAYFRVAYEQRQPFTELFKQISIPMSTDMAYSRAKTNIPRFVFYYLCVAAVFLCMFLFSNFYAVIPISIAAASYYASKQNYKVAQYELTPQILLYGCIAVNVLTALVFSKVMHVYFSFIVFASLCVAVVLGHAVLMEDKAETATDGI